MIPNFLSKIWPQESLICELSFLILLGPAKKITLATIKREIMEEER
jgi:hypothetical protein